MFTFVFKMHRINSLLATKLGFFSTRFLLPTSRFLILAEAFRNDYVAACSTALRSATEKNELGGYIPALCPSKMSTAD